MISTLFNTSASNFGHAAMRPCARSRFPWTPRST